MTTVIYSIVAIVAMIFGFCMGVAMAHVKHQEELWEWYRKGRRDAE